MQPDVSTVPKDAKDAKMMLDHLIICVPGIGSRSVANSMNTPLPILVNYLQSNLTSLLYQSPVTSSTSGTTASTSSTPAPSATLNPNTTSTNSNQPSMNSASPIGSPKPATSSSAAAASFSSSTTTTTTTTIGNTGQLQPPSTPSTMNSSTCTSSGTSSSSGSGSSNTNANSMAPRVAVRFIDWSTAVHMQIDDSLSLITQASIPKVRSFINTVMCDVLLYMSPVYGPAIVDSVIEQLNTCYIEQRDKYSPAKKVTIVAHSLGGVIFHDILTRFEARLVFKVHRFICIGSPLGLFALVGGLQSMDRRIRNVYHPLDPVAYRIEPLEDERYKNCPPVMVPSAPAVQSVSRLGQWVARIASYAATSATPLKAAISGVRGVTGGSSNPMLVTSAAAEAAAEAAEAVSSSVTLVDAELEWLQIQPPLLRPTPSSSSNFPGLPNSSSSNSIGDGDAPHSPTPSSVSHSGDPSSIGSSSSSGPAGTSQPSNEPVAVPAIRRDFQMQLGSGVQLHMVSSYAAALRAHTQYWWSRDVAQFILTQIQSVEEGDEPDPPSLVLNTTGVEKPVSTQGTQEEPEDHDDRVQAAAAPAQPTPPQSTAPPVDPMWSLMTP